jgi:hypothetical protein
VGTELVEVLANRRLVPAREAGDDDAARVEPHGLATPAAREREVEPHRGREPP